MLAPVDLNRFKDALVPLIKAYHLEGTEQLELITASCFRRWKESNGTPANVEDTFSELLAFIKENFGDDGGVDVLVGLCEKTAIRLKEMERQIVAHENDLRSMQEANRTLTSANEQMRIVFTNTCDQLRSQIMRTTDRIDISESYNFAFDLSPLFIFYHVSPALKSLDHYRTEFNMWMLFNEKLTMLKRQHRNGQVESAIVTEFVKPLQDHLSELNVDVSSLHEMIQNRNIIHPRKIRSTFEQESFIEEVSHYQFTPKFLYVDLTKQVLNILTNTSLKRYVN